MNKKSGNSETCGGIKVTVKVMKRSNRQGGDSGSLVSKR